MAKRVTTLVVGASGATGRLLVQQLLDRGQWVKVMVRSLDGLPAGWAGRERLAVVHASVLDLDDEQMSEHVRGCDAVVSCLGHNLSFKGLFGPPRRLVTDATRRLCDAAKAGGAKTRIKFILMNSTGCRNHDLNEPVSWAQRVVVGFLRLLLPPHADNEEAGDYLRVEVGQDDEAIEWVVVRPDSLTDAEQVTAYDVHPSPTRSAIFNAGKTSRINVAHLMAELVLGDEVWERWRGQMPVLYNR